MKARAVPLALAAVGLAGSADKPAGPAAVTRESYTTAVPPGWRISMLRGGTPGGRRVIFIHGTPGDAAGWRATVENAPAGFEYLAIDRPGFGQSQPADAVVTLAAHADAIAPLLVARNGHWPILVGHSYGALDPGQEKVHPAQWVGEWLTLKGLLPRMLANANRELLALKHELIALAPRLDDVRQPVTIIHGTADVQVPYANVPYMTARFTAAHPLRVIRLDRQDHFLPWKHPRVIAREIAIMARAT
ncbi:alpha/beta fold hydrolase [Sphingomonas sp. CCH16-B10]|uniref:alpha/beta fold hydrolase n=1 Tax=Sphingomonas sp. CCH16-B10 TaxID=1768755 RepID=UPI00082CC690|nr:alpha/beta fold hydrolase [Sphingomonas sp. CCH16-B10]